jgi:hypothetical protein
LVNRIIILGNSCKFSYSLFLGIQRIYLAFTSRGFACFDHLSCSSGCFEHASRTPFKV